MRKLNGCEPIKTIVQKHTLPTRKSQYRKVLKFKGIQSSHCITFDRDTNTVRHNLLLTYKSQKFFIQYYNNIWPDKERTSGLPLDLEVIKEKRPSTEAGRYKKVVKTPTSAVKLRRTAAQRNVWEEELKKK